MTKRGIMQEGIDRTNRIPGQMNEMTFGSVASLPMQMSMNPSASPPKGDDKVVDLFLEVDQSNPQFMSIYGKIGENKLPVGRIHNTNLGNREGLRHTFHEMKGSLRRSLGLKESDDVMFGDFTWRENLVPYTIEKMISEALDYNDIQLVGQFGPNKTIQTRGLIRETKWFSQPSMHVHDPVTLDEAVNLKKLPTPVKKKVTGIMAMFQKTRNKAKAVKALTRALKGHVGDPEAAAKYMIKTMSLTGHSGSGMAMESSGTELECPECEGRFLVTEESLNEDEAGTFVICPHCESEAAIDEVTRADLGAAFKKGLELAGKAGSGMRKQLAQGKESAVRKVSGAKSTVYKAFKSFKPGKTKTTVEDAGSLDEATIFTTLGTDKALKGYKQFPVGQGKIMSLRAGLKKGIIPHAKISSHTATKYIQMPKSMKNKQKVTAAYAVGKHHGAQEAARRMTVTGLAVALGTMLGIAGFKKMLGTSTYAKIKKATAEFVNSKIKGHDIGTEKQVTHAINTVTELPRVRWKLKNIAHTLQSVDPAKRQKAIEKASMEIGLIVLKEIGL